ncbi:hypothetical protein ACTOB_004434 [Actinoplanes oblitus]|uniref:Uncharacterized protein n=1 Tax=Actinoplanes oblitus TaxID=3040509 RepID=A0ABY8W581_9ACTN|nr:hypothetical protein [Actinoplanes oblitus]WIM92492.1 hypothetical protein ACTOB_004434 [Actinoplanes oblitus]
MAHVAALRPLTGDVVRALNPKSSLVAVRTEVAATGYPIATAVSWRSPG